MTMDINIDTNLGRQRLGSSRFFFLRPQYILGGVLILLLIGAVYAIVSNFLSGPPPRIKQVVHEISLLPPPPQIEQPPQPQIKEEVNIPEPQQAATPDDAPPPGDLGLDADGNGSDGFQLSAREGGRDLLAAGGPFAWYTSRIQDSIKKVLSANKKARNANYDVQIKLWLKQDGSVERFELTESTGNSDLDQSSKLALAKVEPLGSELPADLKQPVRLRIVSRQ